MVITKIQAATDVKIITRLAAYIRVSSDSEDQLHSFSAQYRYYNSIAANSDDTILIDIYADEGITGTCTDKRDEFNRMMSDARKHKFDRIIVKSVTRFARNTKDCLEAVRELKQLGISVYFEENNIDTNKTEGETLITLLGMVAQNESLSISKNLRWSIQKRMQEGTYVNSNVPFGYRYIDRTYIIDEEESKIVKQMFDLYLNGNGFLAISQILYEQTGIFWYKRRIRHILTNEKYIGDTIYQKRYTTDTFPFQKKRNRGEKEQYYAYQTHKAIIDKEIFDKVQELLKKRDKPYNNTQYYTFTQKIVCNNCKHIFKRKLINKKVYWVCNWHDESADNCSIKPIPEIALQNAYTRMFNKLKRYNDTTIKSSPPLSASLRT